MKKISLLYALGFMALLTVMSCGEDEAPVTIDCTTVTYSTTIKTLVANNCSGSTCHGVNGTNGDYTTYDKIKDVATNGKMRTEVVDAKSMPVGGSLTDTEIAQVKCWLDDGAPDN